MGVPGPAATSARRLSDAPTALDTSSRTVWAIALPVILAELSEHVVEVTDTAFLGRVGTIELAAVGLAAAMYEVVVFFTLGLSDGIQILTARRAGQGRARAIGDAFFHGASLLLATACVAFLILEFGSPALTSWVVRSDAVRTGVDDFVRIIAFAAVFHCLNMAYSAFYVGIGRTRVLVGATAVLALTNVGLDYVLIFGHLGFPRLGIEGAALGAVVSEIVAFAFLTCATLWNGDARRFGLFRPRRLDRSLTRVLLAISWPAALDRLVGSVRWFLFFLIVEHVGEQALALANVVHGVYALLLLPIGGFAETVCTLTSNLIGQERPAGIGGVLRRTMGWAALCIVPFALLALVAPALPLSLFTSDPELVTAATSSLRVVILAILLAIPAEIVFSAVAGTGNTRTALGIELVLSATVLVCAYAAGMVLRLPVQAMWAAEVVGWSVCLVCSALWLKRARWSDLAI